MLISITAFSQVEIVENFDGGIPSNWTSGGYSPNNLVGCGGTGLGVFANISSGSSKTLTTPNYTAISNGTNLTASFDYNIFTFGTLEAPPAGWGTIELEYSTDNGANWTNITTITDADYTYGGATNNCSNSGSISAGVIADGSDFQARLVATNASVGGIIFSFDNISIVQVSNTPPNCDATLISPANGSNTANPTVNLTWQAATSFPTGYKVSVGTMPGGTDIVNAATTTDTSYPLSGLNYATQYFVNIIPFNSNGDASTGCTEESFTTRVEPITGASCDTAFDVTFSGGLYATSSNTDLYEDVYDSSPCSNYYLSGKDVFYKITPTADISINIDLVNISGGGASIHVVEGCIDAATECLGYVSNGSSSTTNLNLSEIVLTAGNTYYVVLSSNSNSRVYTYNLLITQNSCVRPAMTLTPAPDCGNGQFYVDANITYLGSATSLTLTDGVNTISNITSTGIVNIGPYASGATANLTLINEQDGACDYADSTYYFCPPTNDECSNPMPLTVNTDGSCTVVTSATNAGATQSADASACTAANRNDVWFSFVATNETLILEYLNVTDAIDPGASIMATELLEGTCGSLNSLGCSVSLSNYVTLSGLTVNNTYYIRNFTNNANVNYAQSFDVCLKTPPAPPANDDCANATTLTVSTDNTCNNQISGSTLGATASMDDACGGTYNDVWYVLNPTVSGSYNFHLVKNGTTNTYYSVYSGSCGALSPLGGSCTSYADRVYGLDSSETYYVAVRSSQNGPGIDFDLCVYQLLDAAANNDCSSATVLLESSDSNGNNATPETFLTGAYTSPQDCSTSAGVWYSFTPTYTGMYHFEFTRSSGSNAYYAVFNTDNCADATTAGYVPGFSSCNNSSSKTGNLVAGNTYLISVHASNTASGFTMFAYPDPSLGIVANDFETFKYYPNPVANNLTIEAGKVISKISVYNLVGQEVKRLTPNNLSTTINMNELENGVYFVNVTINNSQKTIKVIKN